MRASGLMRFHSMPSATGGIAWLPEAYAGELAKLNKEQAEAMAAQAPKLAKALVKVPAGPVAFTHVKLFDADAIPSIAPADPAST